MRRRWKSLCKGSEEMQLEEIVEKMETVAQHPLRIC
jgi:hypothetical protein